MGNVPRVWERELMATHRDPVDIVKHLHPKGFDGMERLIQAVKVGVPVDMGKGGF